MRVLRFDSCWIRFRDSVDQFNDDAVRVVEGVGAGDDDLVAFLDAGQDLDRVRGWSRRRWIGVRSAMPSRTT